MLSGLLLALAALVVVAGTALVLVRPQQVDSEPRQARSRDLMLCLDASVSMDDDNLAVVREVRRIVDDLRGDRVGLMIWSGAAVLVFPLTDDYDFVRAQLDAAERAFAGEPDGFFAGVDSSGGASLIGDGIVSCVQRFDEPVGRPDPRRPGLLRQLPDRRAGLSAAGGGALRHRAEGAGLRPRCGRARLDRPRLGP